MATQTFFGIFTPKIAEDEPTHFDERAYFSTKGLGEKNHHPTKKTGAEGLFAYQIESHCLFQQISGRSPVNTIFPCSGIWPPVSPKRPSPMAADR